MGQDSAVTRERTRPRRRVTLFGVLGELLITVGAITLLFVAWQLWIGDWIIGAQNNAAGQSQSQQWEKSYGGDATGSPSPSSTPTPAATTAPPAMAQPANAQV